MHVDANEFRVVSIGVDPQSSNIVELFGVSLINEHK